MTHEHEQPVLFTQDGCADSRAVRAWLVARGVPFAERNVTGDPDAAHALAATGTFATPLLLVGVRSVLGYQTEALAELLGR